MTEDMLFPAGLHDTVYSTECNFRHHVVLHFPVSNNYVSFVYIDAKSMMILLSFMLIFDDLIPIRGQTFCCNLCSSLMILSRSGANILLQTKRGCMWYLHY